MLKYAQDSIRSLIWALVLLAIIIYVFAWGSGVRMSGSLEVWCHTCSRHLDTLGSLDVFWCPAEAFSNFSTGRGLFLPCLGQGNILDCECLEPSG